MTSHLAVSILVLMVASSSYGSLDDIVQVPGKRFTRSTSTPLAYYHYKYQTPSHFNVTVSDIYIRVPGLQTRFNVQYPTLFEVTYQGSCAVHQGKGVHIKLLIDNHLIIGDRRTENVPDRHMRADPKMGDTSPDFDRWLSQHHLPFEEATLPIIQSAVVLVAPGFHIFDIGVHHGDVGLKSVIFGGTMRFKWTVLDSYDQVHGLTVWNKTSPYPSG